MEHRSTASRTAGHCRVGVGVGGVQDGDGGCKGDYRGDRDPSARSATSEKNKNKLENKPNKNQETSGGKRKEEKERRVKQEV